MTNVRRFIDSFETLFHYGVKDIHTDYECITQQKDGQMKTQVFWHIGPYKRDRTTMHGFVVRFADDVLIRGSLGYSKGYSWVRDPFDIDEFVKFHFRRGLTAIQQEALRSLKALIAQ